ncbi:hypothetical protein LSH36_16g14023 [Paralvinella palmiformis]|uniref:Transporter n=1 Tax=Paralvinella palmiformis TaxID=53620 RepID=A0AAD9KBD4_9ANNE|nr:hypothetical protein LSH36_16g14023 [Paralvinella palmiformis]
MTSPNEAESAESKKAMIALQNGGCHEEVTSTNTETGSVAYERGTWSRQLDFVFSCVGYAVGLGNLWRFPYLCMRNGGGAFLIPYVLFLSLCGIPLYFMEICLGQFSSRSPMSLWVISPMFKGLGYAMILVSGIVCVYYNVIMAWSLYYMYAAFTGFSTGILPWTTCDNEWNTAACLARIQSSNATLRLNDTQAVNSTLGKSIMKSRNTTANVTLKMITPTTEFWENHVLQLTDGIHNLGSIRWPLLLCLLLAWIIVFACLCKGVKSSGKIGILYYLTPDFSRLLDFKVWIEACAQIFYSLGPAYGGLITMSSYNRFNNNCYRDAILIPVINCMTSFFAGFVVFSVVGFLAYTADLPVSEVITSGPGLAFIVYPEALALLPFSPLWAVIFFFMLVIIGLDTQFGMFETMTSGFVDEFPKFLKGRKMQFTALMCFAEFLLGIPIVTQGGMYIFQIMDWYSATFSLMTISTIECLVIAWRYGVNRLYGDIQLMIGFKPTIWWKICWTMITPAVLACVLLFTVATFSAPVVGEYIFPWWAVAFGWMLALCSIIPIPIVMMLTLLKGTGTVWQRIIRLSAPTDEWCPVNKNKTAALCVVEESKL